MKQTNIRHETCNVPDNKDRFSLYIDDSRFDGSFWELFFASSHEINCILKQLLLFLRLELQPGRVHRPQYRVDSYENGQVSSK